MRSPAPGLAVELCVGRSHIGSTIVGSVRGWEK